MSEREMELWEQYPFEIGKISRVRGAFLCETKEGLRYLRETGSTEKRLRFENEILEKLTELTGIPVDSYVENKEGNLVTESSDKRTFAVKRWPAGRECDMADAGEIVKGAEVLAKLHEGLIQISAETERGAEAAGDWREELSRHTKELLRTRNYIRKKRHKSDLELQILGGFNGYYEQAMDAAARAEAEPAAEVFLCHGDYTHHHLLVQGAQMAVIDFSHMGWDVPAGDLYLFLRKAMEKHGWNRKLGEAVLEGYQKNRELSPGERRYLDIRLRYPEKFWKQVNYYYNRKKSWVPLRNLEKLQLLEQQKEQQEEFLAAMEAGGLL
ncbi:phosphotransferase [Cuneatibacter sp. NSJ-177]|uniref:phosphotransferase n=1 Tax=Cuneatibacter sp. NSJ-177 TaxID=2931401 RepID=UPI001FCF94D6|nr:phosphotransferase [Cuneatibacter sp. NSJ-177]MCJ7836840.1 phosphotransferase [Cuneatibacter sp. NSJ-177]